MAPNTADVRKFLTDLFSDEELTTLCFDYFPEVYDNFASGMSKSQKIQLLIEYGRRREQLTELLRVLQQQRPAQFAKRLEQASSTTPASSPSPQRPASDLPASSNSSVSGGVNLSGDKVAVGKDVVGRDKLIQAGTYIERATIIQSLSQTRARKVLPLLKQSVEIYKIGELEFVCVQAGKFLMGSDEDSTLAKDDEQPRHVVEIPYDYWISRYPVTSGQFLAFSLRTPSVRDQSNRGPDRHDYPMVVSWYAAIAYCKWLNEALSGELAGTEGVIRLPTEAEWEKAARGEHGNEWPWGNTFDHKKCNSRERHEGGGATPVGAYSPRGDSPYGAADMAGNVREWCHSLMMPYPYRSDDGREDEHASGERVLRGGYWYNWKNHVRCASRLGFEPDTDSHSGFRVVIAPPLQ